ncbi:MAG: hypothetical protein ACD_48C00221G0002 [uncultured bacterium]|nr:MAG: hypothetical protein ACD_48C00221G0002 [uncultured bacterium]
MRIVILYGILALALLLYSFTQIDLGMTLTQASIWQGIQKQFQYVGYFNRSLSTVLFISILSAYFLAYIGVLWGIQKRKISSKTMWLAIIVTAGILVFSYPAFSYDFFNYLFTAKTVLVYHKNPYLVIPLQFAGVDPWLSFMHWTHLPSAYTPLWILVTLPPFFFGFGYFLLLLWGLKAVMVGAYIFTIIGIGKILERVDREYMYIGMASFAFNPLIIIESLVSSHNDIVMMALAVWAIVFFQQKKRWISWILLSLSIGMKLMTIFLIPSFMTGWKRNTMLIFMSIGFMAVLFQREVLSWYWVWIVPFISLVPRKWNVCIISYGVSIGLLLRYAPFLYYGNWDPPVGEIKMWVMWVPIAIALVISIVMEVKDRQISSK